MSLSQKPVKICPNHDNIFEKFAREAAKSADKPQKKHREVMV